MSDAWLWTSAADLGRGIGLGETDPRELVEVCLEAVESHPHAPAIYSRVTADRARTEAAAAADRAARGLRRGPLDGVPISWKDLFDSAGAATEAGSALLRGRVPDRDAAALAAAARAGLVCLGKTHMTELAFSGLGVNPSTATPPNSNDPELAPGGSSSGAAASVACGLAAAAIGSDTGGSVRVPAAWNDLAGLKTSFGLVPTAGVVPLCPRFDSVGPLCRTVEDAGLLTAALAGLPVPDLRGATLRGLRFLVLDTAAHGETRPEPAAAFAGAVAALGRAGATVETGAVAATDAALRLAPLVFAPEAYGVWGAAIEARPDAIFAPVRERFRSGATVTAADYVDAWRRLETCRADYVAATAGYDAVLLPTCPILPPPVDALLADHALFAAENALALRDTRVANLLGLCALTLPTGTPCCGLTAMAPAGEDFRLLRVGAAVEAALAESPQSSPPPWTPPSPPTAPQSRKIWT